ncbi:MAG: hypothetical protein JXB48_21845 [Candidatus Latescibacteria bacterium]|nr:hypothetical protein [Candidatus Latescibacterota bacterium]
MPPVIRKKYIVKRDFQLRIFFETVIFMFFVAALVGWTVYLGVFKTIIFELSGEKITLMNRIISLRMFMWFIPTVFAIIIISVFFTHQIAGPIFVFQRTIKNMVDGRPVNKIQLRKNDKLKDLAEDLNRFIDYINKKHRPETGDMG